MSLSINSEKNSHFRSEFFIAALQQLRGRYIHFKYLKIWSNYKYWNLKITIIRISINEISKYKMVVTGEHVW